MAAATDRRCRNLWEQRGAFRTAPETGWSYAEATVGSTVAVASMRR